MIRAKALENMFHGQLPVTTEQSVIRLDDFKKKNGGIEISINLCKEETADQRIIHNSHINGLYCMRNFQVFC